MKSILSTKKLTLAQKELLLNSGLTFVEYNAISIEFMTFEAPKVIENAIFTSKNGVRAVFNTSEEMPETQNCFCVGEKTKALLEDNGQKVIKTTDYGVELAEYLTKNHKNHTFYFFCGNKRLDTIPEALKEANIALSEIETYKTELNPIKFDRQFDGILFFSPSGVQSFISGNKLKNSIAFCIGTTTAAEAEKHTENVVIANSTSVESVIAKAVKTLKK
ncbi:uroporphyrinogen-III synthase [Marixanthomonas spongiae]|uniref:Uroporphyrinogen-III synthase n=1 Tax=Marixanthomonas spongiae TaxID=2174845 RepID=A0A2U0I1W4_9FLAO|nr:uroporphyrinogen-III synthase [Marixanthomonas spongiae]PVW15088.1 uroporphyrinogen-III synthase [Marixanthomonas spongiae]